MTTLELRRPQAPVGAEVFGVDAARMRDDEDLPAAVLAALEEVGVLVFRGLDLDPETQVAFCGRFGVVETGLTHSHEVPGIFRITFDRTKTATADYFVGNFGWHIDGCTPRGEEPPPMVTMLSAQVVADGGDTEFASTYAAYEALDEQERDTLSALRVRHRFEAAVLPFLSDPTPEHLERLRSQPTKVHPLVWTHDSGRRSLVIGTHADEILGMSEREGRALLADLLQRATSPGLVYRHAWRPGDTVLWDNRGLLHRVVRYDRQQPREMLRTTVLGSEPIR